MEHPRILASLARSSSLVWLLFAPAIAQKPAEPLRPDWCRELPRPEYKSLERGHVASSWFEVYRVRPDVYAIYEPHQFEEVISYLIVGRRRALLFDTGLGVASVRDLVTQLTPEPVTVLNSHTHFDHTGGNAEFSEIFNEDTAFSRANAKGQSNAYSRDALASQRLCGPLPPGVHPDAYTIRPWRVTHWVRDGEHIDLGGRELEIIFTPVTPPTRFHCSTAGGDFFSRATPSIQARSTSSPPKPISPPTPGP